MEENSVNKRRGFSTAETVFAWACLPLGFLMSRVAMLSYPYVAALILVAVLYAAAVIMLRVNGLSISPMGAAVGATGLVIAGTIIINGTFISFLSFAYALAAGAYMVFSSTGNTLEAGFSDYIISDVLRAIFAYPFASFGKLFPALTGRRGKKAANTVLYILLGALAAVIPACIIADLLSYDDGFAGILKSVFSFENLRMGDLLCHVIITLLTAMYVFGLYVSSVDRKKAESVTAEGMRERALRRRKVPSAAMFAFVVPVLALYVIFFVSQWVYFLSAFSGTLPEGLTYAEYARSGFFQLCEVGAINLVLIVMIDAFADRSGRGKDVSARAASAVMAVSSLILLGTAAAKMALYVKMYGLTQTRVYASWFMAVLAVIFVLVIVRQLVPGFKLVPISLACCVAMYAVLAFSCVEGVIAKYNVDRYLNKTLYDVDLAELYELGDAAVPEIVRLADELGIEPDGDHKYDYKDLYAINTDATVKERTISCVLLLRDRYSGDPDELAPWTVQRGRALNALRSSGWME